MINDQKNVQLNLYEAYRMEISWDTYATKELVYIIKNENTVWVLTLATGADEFGDRLPIFEQIAGTFSIQE